MRIILLPTAPMVRMEELPMVLTATAATAAMAKAMVEIAVAVIAVGVTTAVPMVANSIGMKKIFAILIVLLVLALVAIAGSYYFETSAVPSNSPTQTTTAIHYNASDNTPTDVLQQTNPDFQIAQKYDAAGNYASAIQYYEEALPLAADLHQEGQIEYYIALDQEKSNDYIDAIKDFKQIAAGSSWPLLEAYAVQELGQIHSNNLSNPSINELIFSDPPYSSFVSSTSSVSTAYHLLYEYAGSIYPLGITESQLAIWDARNIQTQYNSGTTTPQGIAELVKINQELAAADADIQRTKNDPVAAGAIPEILVNEGTAYGLLAQMGVADADQGEQTFQEGMQYEAVDGDKPGDLIRYYYAAFLYNIYGSSKEAQITDLLAPFSVGNDANIYPAASTYLASIDHHSGLYTRTQTINLARLDRAFKAYLISLGWSNQDFIQ